MSTPEAPTHAPPAKKQKPSHKHAFYDPNTNTTYLPFIITKHERGQVVTAIATPKLQMSQNHIAPLPLGEWDKELRQNRPVWIATADGLRYANTAAGWAVVFPPHIHIPRAGGVGSIQVGNPYIETDETGGFVAGWIRAIGIGRSALTGNLMIIDRPIHFSVRSYVEEDLVGKAKTHPTAVVWGSDTMNPMDAVRSAVEQRNAEIEQKIEEYRSKGWDAKSQQKLLIHEQAIEKAEEEYRRQQWEFFPTLRVGVGEKMIGLWANLASPVVTKVFTTITNKKKFGSRVLYAIAERNVLRTALGFYRAPEGEVKERWDRPERGKAKCVDAVWRPQVVVHRSQYTPQEFAELQANYLAGISGGLLKSVEVDKKIEDASSESLLLVEPTGGSGVEEGQDEARQAYDLANEAKRDTQKVEYDEKEQLLIEIQKFTEMLSVETQDRIREAIFGDPIMVDLTEQDADTLRHFLARLKEAAEAIMTKPVTEDPETLFPAGEGDGSAS